MIVGWIFWRQCGPVRRRNRHRYHE